MMAGRRTATGRRSRSQLVPMGKRENGRWGELA
jgi:hypothetical protein